MLGGRCFYLGTQDKADARGYLKFKAILRVGSRG